MAGERNCMIQKIMKVKQLTLREQKGGMIITFLGYIVSLKESFTFQ